MKLPSRDSQEEAGAAGELKRLWRVKQQKTRATPQAAELAAVWLKKTIAPMVKKMGGVAVAWEREVPAKLVAQTALEGYSSGVLTVRVEGSSYLYELKQWLLGGGEQRLKSACAKEGLRKVTLKAGAIPKVPESTWRE